MFSKIVDQKANKLKFNVDGYLTNDRKRQQSQMQNPQGVRREHPPSSIPVPSSSANQIPQQPKLPDPQIKSITIQGKTIQTTNVMLKPIKKQKQLNVYFSEQSSKFKIEIKTIPENGFVARKDVQKGILQLQFKKASKKKSFKEQNNPEMKWMFMNEIKQEKIILVMNNKEYLKNVSKILLDGLVNDDQVRNIEDAIKISGIVPGIPVGEETRMMVPQVVEQDRGDDEIVKFMMPTQQQLNETQKFRKSIKDMKEDEKLYIISDIFKIKKEYEELDRKKFKCPVFGCQKNQKHYRQITQLKTHIKKNHPQLTKHGIEVTEFGTFEYSQKALDLALYLGKIFPGEMKKIIKKMKTRQPGQ